MPASITTNHSTTTSDLALCSDIKEELAWDPAVDAVNIGVSVTDHVVTLAGTVRSLAARLAAVRAARRVKGVHAIVDEIVVARPDVPATSDQAIAATVERILEQSSVVPSTVSASVRDGVVTLGGEVEWQFQRTAATKAVRDIRGVVVVSDQIAVQARLAPRDVRRRIVSALHRNADLDARHIEVAAEGDQVWLSGHVHSLAARQQAETAAWSTPGVNRVVNELTVGG